MGLRQALCLVLALAGAAAAELQAEQLASPPFMESAVHDEAQPSAAPGGSCRACGAGSKVCCNPTTKPPQQCPGAVACCACGGAACDCNTGPAPPGPPPGPPAPPGPPGPAPSPPPPAPPGGWPFFMCSGAGGCGSFATLQWRTSPAQLSHQVGTLSTLPGVPDGTFKGVASRWLAHPPAFKGSAVTLADIATFMQKLLASDPFGTGDRLPYVDLKAPSDNKVVAISQRQLAFIVANSLMGNTVNGTAAPEGLSAALGRCSKAGKDTFLLSLLSLLAVNSVELGGGGALR